MESAAYILFSLALRLVAAAMNHDGDIRVESAIIGLTEGMILHYTVSSTRSWPSQFTAYSRFSFCLLADFVFTKHWERLLLVILSAGLGMVLSDVGYIMWHPRSRCSYCRSKKKPLVSAKFSRSVLTVSKRGTTSHARFMSIPGAKKSDTASLPDPFDDDLENLRNLPRVLIERATPASSSILHLSPDTRLQMPNAVQQPISTLDTRYSSPRTPAELTPDVIFTVPYTRNLQYSPASGSVPLPEASIAIPPLEDASDSARRRSGEHTPTALPLVVDSQNDTPSTPMAVAHASHEPDPNTIAIALASAPVLYDDMDDLESEASPPLSVLSVKGRDELISRAIAIRQEAVAADELCFQLEAERRRALHAGKIKETFLLRQQIEDVGAMSKRLHERAERRYYCGT